MNKKELTNKIISRLGCYNDDWITADYFPKGIINFSIKGIEEPVVVRSYSNITDASRAIANAVIKEGFEYGSCKDIMKVEAEEKQRSEEMNNFMVEGFNAAEEFRIDRLSEAEKIIEIYERYKIKIIEYGVAEA